MQRFKKFYFQFLSHFTSNILGSPIGLIFIIFLSQPVYLYKNLYAQKQDIKFDRISVEHGLSQSAVMTIVQDHQGFMWFGTVDGLNKFDGYSFSIYRNNPADSHSISDDWINSTYVDKDGTLWIGTLSGVLNKLVLGDTPGFNKKQEKFTNYHMDCDSTNVSQFDQVIKELPFAFSFHNCNSITSIYEDNNGFLWIGTFGGGLFTFNKSQEKFTRILYGSSEPAGRRERYITSICGTTENGDNALWIGTFGGGLVKVDENGNSTFFRHNPKNQYSLSDNQIMSLYKDTKNDSTIIWIGTRNNGLEKFDPVRKEFTHYKNDPSNVNSISGNCVLSILQDSTGVLWVGTLNNGLNKFNIEKVQFSHYYHDPKNPNSLDSNEVPSLYQDRSGIIWVGTNLGGGINKFDTSRKKFAHFYHEPSNPNSMSENVVFSLFEDSKGILWIGTFRNGIDRFDRQNNSFTNFRHNPDDPHSLCSNHVRCIYEDSKGVLWIGTFSGGLCKFDQTNNRFKHYKHDPYDPLSLSANTVRSIYEDRSGTLWIGTSGGGLDKFHPDTETFSHYYHNPSDPNSPSQNRIQYIYQDQSGALWLATFGGGLDKFDIDTGKFHHYHHDPLDSNSISDNRIMSILEDPHSSGTFWLGTYGGGLEKFDAGSEAFTHYTKEDGLPNNVVYGILPDNSGNLWLSTNRGLSKFCPQTETFTNYDLSDGLQSYEYNAGAFYKSTITGEMFFGGINGLNCFDPEKIHVNPNIPPIVLTSFKVFDNEMSHLLGALSEEGKIELSYKENFISFEFSALDYANLKKNQFAYRLKGLGEDWIYCGTRRYVSYPNLDPGEYTFQVKGSNCDGVWNEEGISIHFNIKPPFWRMWWFYVLVIGITLSSVGLLYKQRIKINVKRSLELERIRTSENEKIRKTVAADFHDELGQKLTRISLFSEIIKRKLSTNSSESIYYLDKINKAAKELSRSTRDFIWTINPSQDSFHDMAVHLKDFGDEMFDKTGIDFIANGISSDLENVKLPMEWRRHVTLIFKEAMNNVLKHAECKNVVFNIKMDNSELEITLADDGVGCDVLVNSSGIGLNNMRQRAERIHSDLEIISNNGKGTTIHFRGEIPQMGY